MRIIYPYNEILPKKKAHDVFIAHECAALAQSGVETTLLIGKGSSAQELYRHYGLAETDLLTIDTLFMVRKNNPFHLSWNLPFFYGCQKMIERKKPDWVLLSVRKQGHYHLARKATGVRYLYEVHELSCYPNQYKSVAQELKQEKGLLERADLITVTTQALKEILQEPPYSIKTQIEVVPLAVNASYLGKPPPASPLILMYIGQLYQGQGIELLLEAMQGIENVELKILGGSKEEVYRLSLLAKKLKVADSIAFLGFIPPNEIPLQAAGSHGFIAPFENKGRMPYVAHTKLFEYAEWGRPIIAPKLSVVEEHFTDGQGVVLFESGSARSLRECILALQQEPLRLQLQDKIAAYSGTFSWKARAERYLTLLHKEL